MEKLTKRERIKRTFKFQKTDREEIKNSMLPYLVKDYPIKLILYV